MGLQYKIVDKMFFCMSRNSRIGAFFTIEGALQVIGLVSLALTVTLLIKIGFPLQAVLLLLLSVRIGIRMFENYLSIIPYLFSTLVSQYSSYKPREPRSSELRRDRKNVR